jgi:hypothetical protein
MTGKRSRSFKCAVHHRDREVSSENDFHLLLVEPPLFRRYVSNFQNKFNLKKSYLTKLGVDRIAVAKLSTQNVKSGKCQFSAPISKLQRARIDYKINVN